MGAKSKTKSCGRPSKTPIRPAQAPSLSPEEELEVTTEQPPVGEPDPSATDPEQHLVGQANPPPNQDPDQSTTAT
ncbi:hypothetical protein DSO57_1018840 [Entomophthora muscae]|uniref:Uncharacterized protein n=1 Tax=Entomophthora muscae TaxID=34485 RepID=A0ACC2UDH0_9FUNG|nr:hypothetical protein DSO57_1018840 [Entomophthora muscae]